MLQYWKVMKPGIIKGNLITAIGGYFYATNGHLDTHTLMGVILGIIGIVGGACVLNNIIDRDIDAKMERTRTRAMVTGDISIPVGFVFGIFLIGMGLAILWMYTNPITAYLGGFGVFVYVCVYSVWTKRQSVHGTAVGSIAGSVPLVVGYVAVSGVIDIRAVFLFIIFAVWQMPHSYGIALRRFDDYKNADIQVLPVAQGIKATHISVVIHTTVFFLLIFGFTIVGMLHWMPAMVCLALGLWWVYTAVFQFATLANDMWGKKIFLQSIVISMVFSLSLGLNGAFNAYF